jgi:hypothetical protein
VGNWSGGYESAGAQPAATIRPADLSDTDRRALERLFMGLSRVARTWHLRRDFPRLKKTEAGWPVESAPKLM